MFQGTSSSFIFNSISWGTKTMIHSEMISTSGTHIRLVEITLLRWGTNTGTHSELTATPRTHIVRIFHFFHQYYMLKKVFIVWKIFQRSFSILEESLVEGSIISSFHNTSMWLQVCVLYFLCLLSLFLLSSGFLSLSHFKW